MALIADADSTGGLHNFNSGVGTPDVSQTIQFSGAGRVVFQWNDPFDAGKVTTDYDIYLFNAAGTAIVYSSKDDNLATDQPLEYISAAAGTYQLVVVRKGNAPAAPVAGKLRYVLFGTVVNAEYIDYNTPVTYGHNSARGAIGTAAIPWYQTYQPEYFTSPGVVTMYFDRAGNRLAEPEVRLKPDVAAIDGVNNTFLQLGHGRGRRQLPQLLRHQRRRSACRGGGSPALAKGGWSGLFDARPGARSLAEHGLAAQPAAQSGGGRGHGRCGQGDGVGRGQ